MDDPAAFDQAAYAASLQQQRVVAEGALMSLAYSDDGRYLVAGSNGGRLSVWELGRFMNADFWADPHAARDMGPQLTVDYGARGALYATLFATARSEQILAVASDSNVSVLRWCVVEEAVASGASALPAEAEVLAAPNAQLRGANGCLSPMCEVNSLAANAERGELYLASGDGAAYVWDLETLQPTATLAGQGQAPLFSVWALPGASGLLTAGEDGAVRIWDVRAGQCVDEIASGGGGFATCVAADPSEAWIAAGGGTPGKGRAGGGGWLSTWHLASRQPLCSMECGGSETQALAFGEDGELLSVGGDRHIRRWRRRAGELVSRVPSSSPALCALAVSPRTQALAVGGYSPRVDVLVNAGNLAFALEVR